MREINRVLYKLCDYSADKFLLWEYDEITGDKLGDMLIDRKTVRAFITNKLDKLADSSNTKYVAVCFIDDITEIAHGLWSGYYNLDFVKKISSNKTKVKLHSLLFTGSYVLRLKNFNKLPDKDMDKLLIKLCTDGKHIRETCFKAGVVHKEDRDKCELLGKNTDRCVLGEVAYEDFSGLNEINALGKTVGTFMDEIDDEEDKGVGYSGKFISFEGGEGSGKTTQIKRLVAKLEELGYDVVSLREPGGSKIAEQIREVILSKDNSGMTERCEALSFAAARAQLVQEKILPELKAGKIVILDRYVDSSYVYQGIVKGLGYENVEMINDFATDEILPDITLYLDVPVDVGFERIEVNNRETNKFEEMDRSFHETVRAAYKELVKKIPRIIEINGNADETTVFNSILKELVSRDIIR